MNLLTQMLQGNPSVSDYKINVHGKESIELFFVKGKLETMRRTNTCDKEVTVYVDHGDYKGEAQFFVYPSTTAQQLEENIQKSVAKALLIQNPTFQLPEKQTGDYQVESNFAQYSADALALEITDAVFSANCVENAALNSVEIFIDKHTESVINSKGLHKTQVRYGAMIETIPTYNGEKQSVELYSQDNIGSFDKDQIREQISRKLAEVKARYEATVPAQMMECDVIFNPLELSTLFWELARDLNYVSVYSNSNLYQLGDKIQSDPQQDLITLTMLGQAPGNIRSTMFDADGIGLGSKRIIRNGVAEANFGSNRYGQYLGQEPTGNLNILSVAPGTASAEDFRRPSLEVISMSGLQVDAYNDYIGGEIRLAYYFDGKTTVPVTGISISGKLSYVLNHLQLSSHVENYSNYIGPHKAIVQGLKIY